MCSFSGEEYVATLARVEVEILGFTKYKFSWESSRKIRKTTV